MSKMSSRQSTNKITIGDFSKNGNLEIRLKKAKGLKRESTVVYEAEPMNVIKEETKSSYKENEVTQEAKLAKYTDSSHTGDKAGQRIAKHQRHSSKTTKKLELSFASIGRSIEAGTLLSKQLVNAKSSAIAFNKQEQRRRRKEIKMKQIVQSTAREFQEKESEEEATYEDVEKKYEQFVIQDYPAKALTSANESRMSNRDDCKEERKSRYRMPPSGRSKKSKPTKRTRKISSSSLSPSNIGSLTSSKLEKSAKKFQINVLEPIEVDNRRSPAKQLKTLSTADIKELNSPSERGDDESSLLKDEIFSSKSLQRRTQQRQNIAKTHKEEKQQRLNAALLIQRRVRWYIARKDFKWKLKSQKQNKKIYHRILYRDNNYHLIQGFLNSVQDIIILIFDLFKKTFTQELNVSKREYILMMDESMGMNTVVPSYLDSSRSASAFQDLNIDQVDFNYLIDKYLDYDDIVLSFIFNNRQKDIGNPYGKEMVHTATLERPDSNAFLSRQFGTSRGSFITETITGNSEAFRMNSGVLGATTFARSSDTSNKDVSEDEHV